MFRGHSQYVYNTPASIGLVANDLDFVMRNGGIGTYFWLTAHLLASRGWDVHLLYCGTGSDARALRDVSRRLGEAGIGFSRLDDFDFPRALRVPSIDRPHQASSSDQVRFALEQLHREHRFNLLEFAEWGGLGFRSIQAKRAGLAFADVGMVVKLHSSTQWIREGNHQWLERSQELEDDFCERYAFEHADHQVSPSRYMLAYARRTGWNVRADARVVPNPLPMPLNVPAPRDLSGIPEIVFFGRLETRKGLEIFLDAVQSLDPQIPVTFLGREGILRGNRRASDLIRSRMQGRQYSLLTDYNREQALNYLSNGNRLAVIASLADNLPFTVIECMVHGIPFVASGVGGIPEIVSDPEIRKVLLFEPTARALRRHLENYLDTDPDRREEWRERLRQTADVAGNHDRTEAAYRDLVQGQTSRPASPSEEEPPVTVGVAYFNHGSYLPEALASLAAQTYPNLEVLVINDGSTDPLSIQVFNDLQVRYPQFRFFSQPNAGIGATRNRGLREAGGVYFIPMDADNVAHPDMVKCFVAAITRNPELTAMTCYYLAIKESRDLLSEKFAYAYRPTAGPHVLASMKNVYGDANAVFRTAAFQAVGGYETDRDTSWEDWEAFVKLVNAGHQVDVIPEYLFYYRHLESGFSRVTNHYLNHQRVLRQFIQVDRLPVAERMALWNLLTGFQVHREILRDPNRPLRYQVADTLHALCRRAPALIGGMKWLVLWFGRLWKGGVGPAHAGPEGGQRQDCQGRHRPSRVEIPQHVQSADDTDKDAGRVHHEQVVDF